MKKNSILKVLFTIKSLATMTSFQSVVQFSNKLLDTVFINISFKMMMLGNQVEGNPFDYSCASRERLVNDKCDDKHTKEVCRLLFESNQSK